MAMLGNPTAVGEFGAVESYSADVRTGVSSKLDPGLWFCSKLCRIESERRSESCFPEARFELVLLINLESRDPSTIEGRLECVPDEPPFGEPRRRSSECFMVSMCPSVSTILVSFSCSFRLDDLRFLPLRDASSPELSDELVISSSCCNRLLRSREPLPLLGMWIIESRILPRPERFRPCVAEVKVGNSGTAECGSTGISSKPPSGGGVDSCNNGIWIGVRFFHPENLNCVSGG